MNEVSRPLTINRPDSHYRLSDSEGTLHLRSDLVQPRSRVLALHGYSQGPEALLGLALAVGLPEVQWILPNLPGHGSHPEILTLDTVRSSLSRWIAEHQPQFVLGFSLGARIALSCAHLPCIAISPPAAVTFGREDREDLLTFLNPRRVREERPMGGLAEILERLPLGERDVPARIFYAQRDLRSVREGLTSSDSIKLAAIQHIRHCNHGDICQMPELQAAVRGALT